MPGITSPTNDTYDIIIVGAGSAACLLATRLSSSLSTQSILVLEAGEHIQNDPLVLTPGLSVSLQSNPKYDWQYVSTAQPGMSGRTVKHPRGKLVGGTSAINSHSVVFPNDEWQDRVAELLGDEGQAEGLQNGSSDDREGDRVKTSFPKELDNLQQAWLQAFEELGYETLKTGFGKSAIGAVTVSNAIDAAKGERSHAGAAYLEPSFKRGNVTLKTGAKVDRIIFDQGSASGKLNARGLVYIHEGQEIEILGREIVISAGVFESPAILERSGIGSKEILSAADIPILYELPGVGENLQDHLNCSLSCEVKDGVSTRDNAVRNPEERKAALEEYQRSRTGRLAEGPAHSFAFTPLQMLESAAETQELISTVHRYVEKEADPRLRAQYPIIQSAIESPVEATATTFLLRSQRNRDAETFPDAPSMVDGNFVTAVAMLAHPFSRGSCHIKSSAPSKHPEIDFKYLSHPLDVEIFARHMRLIERLFQGPTFTALRKTDGKRLPRSFPHPIASLDDARGILAINAATNYHPCGTCAMMKEELGGVVDAKLRVYGTANVRVCDASVLAIVPRGNILSAVYAFAEKAAEIIGRDVVARKDLN
ncbi:hypothetical protein E8E13_011314 [Curvularia kusanoi]|uniref:Glucose-methanol-choline oxidoreductase N-terminal domain-containing protein n=1 Tax=Curvularia kusanoi TaxID=90978 RepID=A0A9P4TJ45_CURKU|nr:hypothetical protein E8E13_011314 [Curvularia kusanoi]